MSDVMMVNQFIPNITLTQQSQANHTQPLLTAMLDSSPKAILVVDQQQQAVFINQALMRFLDIPTREMVYGLNPQEIFSCLDNNRSESLCSPTEPCKMCGVLQAINATTGQVFVQDVRLLQNEHTPLELRIDTRPLILENQNFTMFTLQDIGAERHRWMLDRLFFHDILNTAGLVRGYTDIIQGATDDEMTLIREQLARTSNRLISEIETQRVLNAAENNDLYVDWASVSVVTLLEDLQAQYAHHEVARERGIQIVGIDDVMLLTDATLLGRALGNLIKNALEASAPGDIVSLGCWQEATQVVFAVHNPTISPAHLQPHIFRRSLSTKGRGRGIGTYSAKLLTERYLNGQIAFTTSEDEGTTFTLAYPL
jgi:signal transduction histidine kinase